MFRQRFKDLAAIFVIICLLPYVITVLFSGNTTKKGTTAEVTGQVVAVRESDRTEEMELDQYLVGVLAAQIPVEYHLEAIKAQAVLARTGYVIYEKDKEIITKENARQSFLSVEKMQDLWEEKYDQNYKKYMRAVKDTQGKVLSHNGKLLVPYFHMASIGSTRNGREVLGNDYGYLKSAVCENDLQVDNYITIKTFNRTELCEIFKQYYSHVKIKENEDFTKIMQIKSRDDAGYVSKVEVGKQIVSGETFRSQFQLPSSSFQIKPWKDGVRMVCKGIGHGFGMSLFTANQLAKSGKNYEEILNYFFICE